MEGRMMEVAKGEAEDEVSGEKQARWQGSVRVSYV